MSNTEILTEGIKQVDNANLPNRFNWAVFASIVVGLGFLMPVISAVSERIIQPDRNDAKVLKMVETLKLNLQTHEKKSDSNFQDLKGMLNFLYKMEIKRGYLKNEPNIKPSQ